MLSYPNRKPPRVATLAAITSGVRECAGLDGVLRLLDPKSSGRPLASLRRFDGCLRCEHETEGMRHSSMPGRCTCHLRSVVGDEHAVEVVAVQNSENANHVHIAFIDESFPIVGHFSDDIAQMNIGNLALLAVL